MEDTQPGELTVWTGKNGEGKSTMLGQVILEALDNGAAVFCYSGELTKSRFQEWINTQAAGSLFLEEYKNKYGDVKTKVKKEANDKIKEWYRGRFFLYDNSIRGKNIEHTSILDLCEYAAQKYGCKIFVVDNLMTADFDATDENYYHAQSKFVGNLVAFAKAFNIHIHLVAHPKKTNGELDKEAISGTGDITNRADNVIAIERNYDEKNDYDAILKLLKNRNTGVLGKFPLKFNKKERRFYQINKDGACDVKIYGWNKDDFIPVAEGEQVKCPWD
jgi:twinkle protein